MNKRSKEKRRFVAPVCRHQYILAIGIIWHLAVGTLLLCSRIPGDITGIHTVYLICGSNNVITGIVLVLGALSAIASMHRKMPDKWARRIQLVHQFILAVTEFGVLKAVKESTYADGEPRPWQFIFTDQSLKLSYFVVYLAWMIQRWGRGIG